MSLINQGKERVLTKRVRNECAMCTLDLQGGRTVGLPAPRKNTARKLCPKDRVLIMREAEE